MAKKKGKMQSITEAVLRGVQKVASGGKSTSNRNTSGKSSSSKTDTSGRKSKAIASQRQNRELQQQMLFPNTKAYLRFKETGTANRGRRTAASPKTKKQELKAKKISLPIRSAAQAQKISKPLSDTVGHWKENYMKRSVLPVSGFSISSAYGVDRGTHRHSGIDLAIPSDTKVVAAKKGKVSFAGWGRGYGYRVVIDHEDGTQTTYNHLSDIGVNVGDQVNAGAPIALSGSTGNSTGPHLHFEVKKDGRYVDPSLYFDFENGTTAKDDGAYTSQMASISGAGSSSSGKTSSKRSSTSSGSSSSKKGSGSSSSKRASGSSSKKVVLPSVKYSVPTEKLYFHAGMPSVDDFSFDGRTSRSYFSEDMNPLLALIPSYYVRKRVTKRG